MTTTILTPQTRPVSQFGDLQQARRLRQVSEHYPSRLRLFRRVYAGQTSPRECIKAFCLECNGWEEAVKGEEYGNRKNTRGRPTPPVLAHGCYATRNSGRGVLPDGVPWSPGARMGRDWAAPWGRRDWPLVRRHQE